MDRSIVAIDDDAVIRRLVARILETKGYRVYTYNGGEAALRAMVDLSVDAVICDLVMPGMSGIEVVRALRQEGRHRTVPILLLSGRASTADIGAAMAAGADRYMTKPFSSVDLQETVLSLFAAPASTPASNAE